MASGEGTGSSQPGGHGNGTATHTQAHVTVQSLSQKMMTSTNITNINIQTAGQVIHISGNNNIVDASGTRILLQQPGNSSSDPPTSATASCPPTAQTTYHRPLLAGSSVSHSEPSLPPPSRPTVIYAEGPPDGIELVEVTQKLMTMGDNWEMIGHFLQTPDHELVATKVEERTLYLRIYRLLKHWVNCSVENDRSKLAAILSTASGAQKACEVLKRTN